MSTPPRVGRPPIAALIVEHLERKSMVAAADEVRSFAGLPPRVLTPTEQFIAAVIEQVVTSSVGFVCTDEDEAVELMAELSKVVGPDGRRYTAKRNGSRLEVKVVT